MRPTSIHRSHLHVLDKVHDNIAACGRKVDYWRLVMAAHIDCKEVEVNCTRCQPFVVTQLKKILKQHINALKPALTQIAAIHDRLKYYKRAVSKKPKKAKQPAYKEDVNDDLL